MKRHLKIIFTISVLLNVLLLGVLAGSCDKRWDGPLSRMAENRDPQFNHTMAKAMQDARKGQQPLQDSLKAAKKELNKVLAAEEFDESAFNAASEKMYKAQADLFKARNETTLNMAKGMSADERQEMARHMQAMSERHERMKERWRDREGDFKKRDARHSPPAE